MYLYYTIKFFKLTKVKPMTRKVLFLLAMIASFMIGTETQAQDSGLLFKSKPQDMWEIGLSVGHFFTAGDLDYKPGFGGGIHFRKATDYLFSLRGEVMYGISKGEASYTRFDGVSDHTTKYLAGELQGVISFNNMKGFSKPRKTNLYLYVGAGVSSLDVKVTKGGTADVDGFAGISGGKIAPHGVGGAGLSYKVSPKFNIALDHKVVSVFGNKGDLLDGVQFRNNNYISANRDLFNYTTLRLNFNIGDAASKSEPLYWVSPWDLIADDLAEVKARPKLDLTDTDKDGIIDMLDKEINSPAGAMVDTKGVALDSDGDGIPDHMDKEPFSPPGYKVDSEGLAQIPDPGYATENDVNRIVDAKIAGIKFPAPASNMDWFLPMINFNNNRYSIKSTEYGKLHNVASVMKQNPGLRVVVKGYTDQTASSCYNDVLSYNRAQASIDYLVSKYGIARDRFILNWGGENDAIANSKSSMINRRVEFMVAKGESEMGRPNCGVNHAGKGGSNYSGNKEAGY